MLVVSIFEQLLLVLSRIQCFHGKRKTGVRIIAINCLLTKVIVVSFLLLQDLGLLKEDRLVGEHLLQGLLVTECTHVVVVVFIVVTDRQLGGEILTQVCLKEVIISVVEAATSLTQ